MAKSGDGRNLPEEEGIQNFFSVFSVQILST